MEVNKTVANPMLVGAMQLLKAEDTPEHRQMYLNELTKATLITPARFNPEPEPDEEGNYKLTGQIQVQFPMLNGKDGLQFFVAYTDNGSLDNNEDVNHVATPEEFRKFTVTMSIMDYARMLLTKDAAGNDCPCVGVVINPFGENLLFTKGMAAAMLGLGVQKPEQ